MADGSRGWEKKLGIGMDVPERAGVSFCRERVAAENGPSSKARVEDKCLLDGAR